MKDCILDNQLFSKSCGKSYNSYKAFIRGYAKEYDATFLNEITLCFEEKDFSETKKTHK